MSEPFRALLIGVPYYKDPAIDDLPFIESDLSELARALRTTEYDVLVHDVQETDRDSIDLAVESFFQDAAPGQTLLLYLSGHGIHHDGTDFLVPGGAQTRTHDFPGKCLSLKLSGYVERSVAGNVVVFVDACREGLTLEEMGGVNAAPWSRMRVQAVGDRSYCHVYACSPGDAPATPRPGTAPDERLLKADPWRPVGFAERMTDRVSWLLSKVINPEKLALSPAEAALLVIAPFLYTTYWNHAAARALVLEPENLARVADPARSGRVTSSSSRASPGSYGAPRARPASAMPPEPAGSRGGCCTAGSCGSRATTATAS
ncbi:caspase family protein [Streptomyces sp. NPDC046685]|uniref:caspase family protein n=1 Tax=Streptomyces sp. NPDC046685 TaxID=3157202 RepID=UPI00340CDC0D